MNLENTESSKKKLILLTGMVSILIIVMVVYFIRRSQQPPNNTNPSKPTPTLVQATISPSDLSPTQVAPTINYLTPFPQVSLPVTGTPDDLMKKQIESDKEWGKTYSATHEAYPWMDQFPVKSDYFFLYFQPAQNKFIGKIYDISQEESLKETMKNIIKDKGIDLDKFTIEWTYPQ